ncbi:hypothetical protein F5Y18DRAFT_274893 [Xylariaceae sp. FL1019]|nr:hypothetical protein F5Y18DRAFT_274893 [Xylariaceae sp. FL1019]
MGHNAPKSISTLTRTKRKARDTRRKQSGNPSYKHRTIPQDPKYVDNLRDHTKRASRSPSFNACCKEFVDHRSRPQVYNQETANRRGAVSPKLSSISTFLGSSSAKPPSSKTSGAPSVCDDYVHVNTSVNVSSQISQNQHTQQPTSATASASQLVNPQSSSEPHSSTDFPQHQRSYTYDADNEPRQISEYDANREVVSFEYKDLFDAHFGTHPTTCCAANDSNIDTYWTWDVNKQMWHHRNEETNSERWFSAEIR